MNKKKDESRYKCCCCHKWFTGWGNNAWPLWNDEASRCCDKCNLERVLPARIKLMQEKNH